MLRVRITVAASLLIAALFTAATCSPGATSFVSSLSGPDVFVGTSPCGETPRPFFNIPLDASCDRIKWNLALHRDPKTNKPTTYTLNGEWGYHIDNRTYLTKSTFKDIVGNWTIAHGTKSDPGSTIIQLESQKRSADLEFVAMHANILHLLDRDKSLKVGDSGQSYTLSRTEKSTRTFDPHVANISPAIVRASDSNRSPIVGVFSGRTPCLAVARELRRTVADDCAKIKWQLTLRQDATTLTPTSYELKTTFNRDHIWEGKWTILRGTGTNASATIYQLDPGTQTALNLLKADDNILFFLDKEQNFLLGNLDFSYTLNRTR